MSRPPLRSTYTYAELEVSAAAYDEIAGKLRAAGYDHAFGSDGTIDMHGIGLTRGAPKCAVCDDGGWVCENHPDRPWDGTGSLAVNACGCGAGAPCPSCHPPTGEDTRQAMARAIADKANEGAVTVFETMSEAEAGELAGAAMAALPAAHTNRGD